MSEIDTRLSADSAPAAPHAPRSMWTPPALVAAGIFCSIAGVGISLDVIQTLTFSPHLPLSLLAGQTLWWGLLSLACLAGAALCFVRAGNGYRRGYVTPLRYRAQLFIACFTTLWMCHCIFDAVCPSAGQRDWYSLPLYLFHPLQVIFWVRVFQKRAESRRVLRTAANDLTMAEKEKPGKYWWSDYDTRRQSEESRTDERVITGRR